MIWVSSRVEKIVVVHAHVGTRCIDQITCIIAKYLKDIMTTYILGDGIWNLESGICWNLMESGILGDALFQLLRKILTLKLIFTIIGILDVAVVLLLVLKRHLQ